MRGTDGSANILRGEADLRDLLQDGRLCSTMHRMMPFKQATMVGSRVPTRLLLGFADALAVSKKSHNAMVGTSRAAVNRKMEADLPLCSAHSEYALGLARLIGHVEVMAQESGNGDGVRSGRGLAAFLAAPSPVLGGRSSGELLRTNDGRIVVSTLLAQMQRGAYA